MGFGEGDGDGVGQVRVHMLPQLPQHPGLGQQKVEPEKVKNPMPQIAAGSVPEKSLLFASLDDKTIHNREKIISERDKIMKIQ